MPRVVANQRERFDNDELFRKLSRDMEASTLYAQTILLFITLFQIARLYTLRASIKVIIFTYLLLLHKSRIIMNPERSSLFFPYLVGFINLLIAET